MTVWHFTVLSGAASQVVAPKLEDYFNFSMSLHPLPETVKKKLKMNKEVQTCKVTTVCFLVLHTFSNIKDLNMGFFHFFLNFEDSPAQTADKSSISSWL